MTGVSGDGDGLPLAPPVFVWQPRPKFRDRRWVHASLFVATVATTTLSGVMHYLAFLYGFAQPTSPPALSAALVASGFWYSATILTILGCHELGHYFACRYYDVDASLPFFLPVPVPLTGTLGAFIRIREPIPTKRMLFDIGIAGPIAGFLIAVPALFVGLSMSRVELVPPNMADGYNLGEPLLFQLASRILWGTPPDGYSLNLHPIAFAAWFGLIATALNLFPINQLDGGHISYAVLGRRSTYVTVIMIAVVVALAYLWASWLIFTGLMIAMLVLFGPHHPRTADEDIPLDRARVILAIVALVMFIVCFTPAPIEPIQLIRR